MTIRSRVAALAAATMLALAVGRPALADKVLHVAPHADLKILDPHTNTATITLMHGLMIYDMLYNWDEDLKPRPQMVESETISPDKLTYTFTLRPGLKFHDGTAVTTRDVIPSLKRWMVRDVMGQKLAQFTSEMKPVDDRIFTLQLKEPFPFVETALAASSGTMPVIMREKEAMIDPFTNVTETIGSGPFRFVKAEWVPGAKVVYEKNPDYVPRADPPNGLAGGKVVKVDRVEFNVLPDPTTKGTALQAGEIDIIDQLPHDQAGILAKAPGIVVARLAKIDNYGLLRPNSLFPPFNNLKARQALAMMVNQEDYVAAAFGDKQWWRACFSYFVCDTANGTDSGSDAYRKPNIARAKQLLAESGYKGETIIMLSTHEIASIGALGDVTAANLKAIGMNVEIVETDWGTLVARRASKNPPDQGGWNIFHTTSGGSGMYSPLTNFAADQSCGAKNWFGWPCDDKAEELRTAYIKETDPAKQKAALEAVHAREWETIPYVLVGQYSQPTAWRQSIGGLLRSNIIVFWNVTKG
jgi:peptide/nickel transport system substrate-binding protein